MESKHKNILIGTLLAVVFVMAVGYAAFAQQLTINGSAEITSTWDVHMTNDGKSVTPTSTMGTSPSGEVNVEEGGLSATFTANLVSPGDKVTFVVPIVNEGTIDAELNDIVLSSTTQNMNIQDLVATTQDGNIKYTVTKPTANPLTAGTGKDTVTIVAEFVDQGNQGNLQNVSAQLTVTMNYVQA